MRGKAALCAIAAAIMLSSGTYRIALPALASSPVAQEEALFEAVDLYERLSGGEVEVPAELTGEGVDAEMIKPVMLGYINLDDTGEDLSGRGISRQDYLSVLYKTVVRCDESYAISEEEADAILNNCYNNAYIDDVNRIPYAFMMKQGIVSADFGTDPYGELTKEECEELTQRVYGCFAQDVTITVGTTEITAGANIDTVLSVLGEPNRIDNTEFGFEWYVYNSDYSTFCMVGVCNDRICAIFTNCSDFDCGGVSAGDDFAQTAGYDDEQFFTFYPASDGTVDAVLYNPYSRGFDISASVKRSKSMILLDMINANRAKNGRPVYAEDYDMSAKAWLSSIDTSVSSEYDDSVIQESGFDVFAVYGALVENGSGIMSQNTEFVTPVGISTSSDMAGGVTTSIVSDTQREAEEKERDTVEIPQRSFELNEVDEVTTPVIAAPRTEDTYDEGDDIVIELEMQASTKYHIEVFDVESDEYAVNEYVVTDSTEIVLPRDLFTAGRDYRLVISSITPEGESLSSDEILISYGSAYDTGVEIIAPYNDGILDDDYLEITWKSDAYHDFCVDMYNQNDELVVSKVVEGEQEALIKGVQPGKYYLYVTAFRRGTRVAKARDCVTFTARLPEPVVNEVILDKDDVYYYVYEDEDMGLLYFYDEELVDVEEKGKTVTKKKIIQKQVKATKGYRRLAKCRTKPASTTGDPTIMQHTMSYNAAAGDAIVREAEKYLGVPYVWGGTTPDGFDCSGLVKYVCSSLGINVNRVAEDQFENGISVNRDELEPGDLIFFEQSGYIHHVGIYVGDNMMIHAPQTGDVVKYQSIDTDYYRGQYAGARRVY